MNYYLLQYSSDEKIVGTYPQTDGYYPGYNDKSIQSITNLRAAELPNFKPDLRFKLNKKAILTNIIKVGNINRAKGLFVDEKAKKLFELFNLSGYAFYDGFVEINDDKINYFWLHIIDQSLDMIDFANSKFHTTILFKKGDDIKLESKEDLRLKLDQTKKLIIAEEIALKNLNTKMPDIFVFPIIQKPDSFFISEKMAEIFLKEKISGIEIAKTSIIKS